MGTRHSTSLADALFSRTQQRVLGVLYGDPERSFFASEIFRRAGSGRGAVQRELQRLTASGLARVTRIGNQKHYQANRDSPVFSELRSIVLKTSGLAEPLRKALRPLGGKIDLAIIYGSVARGEDRPQSDVDVLVIGPVSTIMAQAAFKPVARAHNRKINANAVTEADLISQLDAGSAFWRDVLTGPLIKLKGEIPDEVARRLRGGAKRRVPAKGRRSARHS